MERYTKVIWIAGELERRAYEAMNPFVPLPPYDTLVAALQRARSWNGEIDPDLAWQRVWLESLPGWQFESAFVPPTQTGLLEFTSADAAHPSWAVWLTCPLSGDAAPTLELVFHINLAGYASFVKEGDFGVASALAAELLAPVPRQSLFDCLPDLTDAQPFVGYEVAELVGYEVGGPDVRFSTVPSP